MHSDYSGIFTIIFIVLLFSLYFYFVYRKRGMSGLVSAVTDILCRILQAVFGGGGSSGSSNRGGSSGGSSSFGSSASGSGGGGHSGGGGGRR